MIPAQGLAGGLVQSWGRRMNFDGQYNFDLKKGSEPSRSDKVILPKVSASAKSHFVKLRKPTPTVVFETYWRFAKKRQDMFFASLATDPVHLQTGDPILRGYRFTNAYRASDRVSQYLIRHVIYDEKRSVEDTVFRLLLFKFFNKIDTWEALTKHVGEISWKNYSYKAYEACLSKMMRTGIRIYSAAYIMPSGSSAYGHERKHQNHLKIIEAMMKDRVPERVAQQPNLASVYDLLIQYPCIGPFTGYQYTTDLGYTDFVNFSENDFVQPGPGALDGITKCFSDLGDFSPADAIRYMADIQDKAFANYAPGFRNLWGRSLHLIDCQNLFCEVDKYSRVAHPEIAGKSGRTRIKQSYKRSLRPKDAPWYPPKWEINSKIESP